MDVFLLLFLIVCLIGAKIAPRGALFNEAGLDRDHTTAIRGFLCVLIVLDHSALLTGCGYSAAVLKRAGPYVVCLFYALSAYGLLTSYLNHGCSLKGFWKKRLLGTVLPYLVLYVAAVVLRLLLGEHLTAKEILLSFVNGHPLIQYSWFIITIIVFYAVFWLAALLAKKDLALLTGIVGFALFVYVFAVRMLNYEDFWYNAAWGFPFGLIWQRRQKTAAAAFRRHPWIWLAMTGAAALWWVAIAEHFFWFGYLARLCATLAVTLFTLLLMFKLKIGNPVLRLWGRCSLEIYLIHGLLVTAMSAFLAPKEQPYLFVGLLLAGTVLLSWLFHCGYSAVFLRKK